MSEKVKVTHKKNSNLLDSHVFFIFLIHLLLITRLHFVMDFQSKQEKKKERKEKIFVSANTLKVWL